MVLYVRAVFYTGTSVYFTNSLSPIITTSNGGIENANVHYYHLVKPIDEHQYFSSKISDRLHKSIPEIYLTRLLSTKGTIQKFVDDFFGTILTANDALPPAVKWLFDLFDEAFRRHNIMDPEVLHAWKSNRWVGMGFFLGRFFLDRSYTKIIFNRVVCVLVYHWDFGWILLKIQISFSISIKHQRWIRVFRWSLKRSWIRVRWTIIDWARIRPPISYSSPKIYRSIEIR